jgi:F-type H+-transporting ATPase subunit b
MVEVNYTVWIQMVNFIVLIFVLNILLYKPILKIIDKRNRQLEESDEEVKGLQETVDQRMAEYEEKVRQAKLAALDQKKIVQQEGSEEGGKIIEEAKNNISRIIEEAHVEIGKEMDEARGILENQSRKTSIEIAEKVLGRGIQ